MTPGYDPADSAGRGRPVPPGWHPEPAESERLGPRPPRPGPPTGFVPAVATPRPTASFATHGSAPDGSVPVGGPASTSGSFPAARGPLIAGAGAAWPAGLASSAGSGLPASPARRRGRLRGIAAVVIALLLIVVGVQGYLLWDLHRELAATERAAAAQRAESDSRLQGLEARTKELERQAGNTLDAAAVAGEVVPSVFRLTAGDRSGSAFAFGGESNGGGTNLLTNFHVVEPLYGRGGRDVALEQQNKRFVARIVRVDQRADLALLTTPEKFPRLQPAAEAAKPGQPVVVVGAPFGLQDSVTSGVISALRTTSQGPVLQFDAPVNPGNSGGPVVNAQKHVVGVVFAEYSAQSKGLGLAIPVAVACQTFGLC